MEKHSRKYESLSKQQQKKIPLLRRTMPSPIPLCHISAKLSLVNPLAQHNPRHHFSLAVISSFEQEMGNCHDEPVVIRNRQKCLLAVGRSKINILLSSSCLGCHRMETNYHFANVKGVYVKWMQSCPAVSGSVFVSQTSDG